MKIIIVHMYTYMQISSYSVGILIQYGFNLHKSVLLADTPVCIVCMTNYYYTCRATMQCVYKNMEMSSLSSNYVITGSCL